MVRKTSLRTITIGAETVATREGDGAWRTREQVGTLSQGLGGGRWVGVTKTEHYR